MVGRQLSVAIEKFGSAVKEEGIFEPGFIRAKAFHFYIKEGWCEFEAKDSVGGTKVACFKESEVVFGRFG